MSRLSVRGLAWPVLWLVCGGGAAAAEESEGILPEESGAIRSAVEAVFRIQEEAWNRGDVVAFMEH